mmetsp:Transcript_7294/g.16704  ORF Transcript_7294/g.16704 Transcript_7294/m.16704 type:complete len:330 (-) Transcript_7294:1375-2364(-)
MRIKRFNVKVTLAVSAGLVQIGFTLFEVPIGGEVRPSSSQRQKRIQSVVWKRAGVPEKTEPLTLRFNHLPLCLADRHLEVATVAGRIDNKRVALHASARQQQVRSLVQHMGADVSAEGACAILLAESLRGHDILGCVRDLHFHPLIQQKRPCLGQLDVHDPRHVLHPQPLKENDIVKAVQELGRHEAAQLPHHSLFCFLRLGAFWEGHECLCPYIRGHDDNDIRKVDPPSLPVRQPALIQHLEQHILHRTVCLFELVKEDNLKGPPPHALRQLPPLVVAYVSRGGAYKPRDRVFLHILAHVDSSHCCLIIQQKLAKRFRELRLPNTSWS